MLSTIRKFWSNWFASYKQEDQQRISTKRQWDLDDDLVLPSVFPKRRCLDTGNMFSLPAAADDFLCPNRDQLVKRTLSSTGSVCKGARSRSSLHKSPDRMQETKENIIAISLEEPDTPSQKHSFQNGARRKSFNSNKEKKGTEWTPLKPFSKHDVFLCPNRAQAKVADSDVQILKEVEPKGQQGKKAFEPIPYRRIAVMGRRKDDSGSRKFHSVSRSISSPAMNSLKLSTRSKQSASESFRLDERQKYEELVQKVAGITTSPSPFISGIFRPSLENAKPHQTSSVEVIDLSKEADDEPAAESIISDVELLETDDESNEVIKKTKEDPKFDPNWPTELTMVFDHKTRDRRKKMEQERLKWKLHSENSEKIITGFLEEQIQTHLRITEVALPEIVLVEEDEELKLPPFTAAMESLVNVAFRRGNEGEVLVECFSQRITRRDLLTLSSSNWLNDEVINFYMNLLIERGKAGRYPKTYGFNTFFYPKLMQTGYASLKRWTRKVDIFAHDILIVPVHLGVHWCMAAVDLRKKIIKYYDSMGSSNNGCLQALFQYLQEEMMDKKKEIFDKSGWKLENVKNIPQQMNGSDCGVFACMYAEFLSRDAKINFTQTHMPYFRRKMAYEILSKKLML